MHKIECREISNRKYLSKTILACRERQAKNPISYNLLYSGDGGECPFTPYKLLYKWLPPARRIAEEMGLLTIYTNENKAGSLV